MHGIHLNQVWRYRIYSMKCPGHLVNFSTFRAGAYSRWTFIRSWALIKISPFLFHLIYTFWRAYEENEVSVKVIGSKTLENRLVVPKNIENADTKQGYCHEVWALDFAPERTLRPHGHFSENLEENSNVVIKIFRQWK